MAVKDFLSSSSIKSLVDVTATNQLKSLVVTGTAPLSVVSTTKVTNLNVDLLDGYHADTGTTLNTIPVRNGSGALPGDITGNAATVTNGVVTTGSYSNPSWITGLAWSKISTTPTTLAGYGITDAQALDADLTAIAALAGTSGYLRKTGIDTWTLDTGTFLTAESDTLQTVTGRGASSNVATITLSANTTSSGTGTGTLVVTGGVGIGGALNIGGNTVIGGNLTVNGTTITVNSTTVTVDDPIFTLGGDTPPGADDNKDRGIEFRYYSGSAKVGFFGFDDSTGYYTFLLDATNTGEVFSGTKADIDAGNFRGNLIPNAKISFVAGTAGISGSINIPANSSGNTAVSGDLYGSATGLHWHNGTADKILAYTDSTLTGTWNGGVIGTTYGGTGVDGHLAANGTLLIGNSAGFTLATLTAGANAGVTITNAAGSITLSTVQDIRTSAAPTFAGLTISGGTPTAPTAAADTNTTQLATTAFVVGQASATNPAMDGTVAIGTSLKYARADHVHPTDTSREASITAGTTAQYWRGDKSWQTLNSTAVGLGNVTNVAQLAKDGTVTATGKISFIAGSAGITGSINIPATSTGNTAVSGDLYGSATGLYWHNGTAVKTIAYTDSTLTGTWNGSVIGLAKGGTNADLSATGAAGGVAYHTGTAISLTGAGTSGQFLKSGVAAAPTWAAITESDITDGTLLARVGGNETITGTWVFNNEITNGNTKINGTITASLASTAQTAVDTNAIATVRALKYIVQAKYTTEYQISEIVVIHNGTTAYCVEYAINYTSANPLVTFDADITGGNVRLLATAVTATTDLKIMRVNVN